MLSNIWLKNVVLVGGNNPSSNTSKNICLHLTRFSLSSPMVCALRCYRVNLNTFYATIKEQLIDQARRVQWVQIFPSRNAPLWLSDISNLVCKLIYLERSILFQRKTGGLLVCVWLGGQDGLRPSLPLPGCRAERAGRHEGYDWWRKEICVVFVAGMAPAWEKRPASKRWKRFGQKSRLAAN